MTAGDTPANIDVGHMRRALALAQRGWGQTAPNPMVGAVVVASNEIVGEGFHARYGSMHGEVAALRDAGESARGATLYVSLEPCAHFGKTPPCTDAIIAAGLARVVAAVRDPSPIASGGVEKLRAAGVAVDVGIERAAALELNAPFFNAHGSDRPWIILKLAISADGAIADASRKPRWISGSESRTEVHRLRSGVDAVAVGIGTVLSDDPALTVRDVPAPRVQPTRVVFDSRLRIPLDASLVRTASEISTVVIARHPDDAKRRALSEVGVTVLAAPTLRDALIQLRQREIRAMLVEGGAGLAGALLGDDLVDRLIIFRSPIELGDGSLDAFANSPADFAASLERRPIIERRTFGDDIMTTYALRETPCSPD